MPDLLIFDIDSKGEQQIERVVAFEQLIDVCRGIASAVRGRAILSSSELFAAYEQRFPDAPKSDVVNAAYAIVWRGGSSPQARALNADPADDEFIACASWQEAHSPDFDKVAKCIDLTKHHWRLWGGAPDFG